jgi:hypothetical protein
LRRCLSFWGPTRKIIFLPPVSNYLKIASISGSNPNTDQCRETGVFVGQEWRTSTGLARRHPLESWGSLCKEDAGPLIIGERDGNMPQDRRTAPGHRWPSAPSARNRRHQSSNPGAYLAYRSLFHLKFELFRLFTLPSVSHRDFSSLNSLSSHISAGARSKRGCLGITV